MRAQRVFSILVCLSLLPLSTYALTLPGRTLVGLMKSSDVVVHGVVETVEPTDSRQPGITATVALLEVLKGTVERDRVAIQLEAIVTRDGEVASPKWEARLAPGEEVVVFLTRLGDEDLVVTGGVEGKFTLYQASDGAGEIRSTVGPIPIAGLAPEKRPSQLSLEDFLARLRVIAAYPQ